MTRTRRSTRPVWPTPDPDRTRAKRRRLVLGVAAVAGILAIMSTREPGFDDPGRERLVSPDGRFEAVIRTGFSLRVFAAIGDAGSQPGHVTIYDRETRASCGTAPVGMVGAVTLDWNLERGYASVARPREALWDLEACTVRFDDLYP